MTASKNELLAKDDKAHWFQTISFNGFDLILSLVSKLPIEIEMRQQKYLLGEQNQAQLAELWEVQST